MLVAAACVSYEQRQERGMSRIRREFQCRLQCGEDCIAGRTWDISESGVRVALEAAAVPEGRGRITISHGASKIEADTTLIWHRTTNHNKIEAAFRFDCLPPDTHRSLVQLVFCDDNSWGTQTYPKDNMARSFWYLLTTFWRITQARVDDAGPRKPALARLNEVESCVPK
jgi:hypothetical protein